MSDVIDVPSPRPPIFEVLARRAPEVEQRMERRLPNPGVAVDENPGPLRYTSPHNDQVTWEMQVADAFGSNSPNVAQMFLGQLAGLCSQLWQRDRWEPDPVDLNAILGIINSLQPENELQAALAAQMVAIHFATMKVSTQTLGRGLIDKASASVMARLAATYAMQCQTLERLKGRRGHQEITVRYERHDHKHVHLEGGSAENGDQPHAPRARRVSGRAELAHCGSFDLDADGTAVPGPDAIG
jgi:hypothetical protein